MWRAIGSSGSSASHSSNTSIALSTSPSVQCASASNLRASGCVGRSVITFEKQIAASCERFWPFSSTPRLWYASECSGSMRMASRYAASASAALAFRPQHDAEVVVRVGVARLERDRTAVGGDRIVELDAVLPDDAEIAVPVRALGLELEASLDQRDRLLAPRLLVGEHAGEVQRVGVVRRGLEHGAVDLVGGRPLPVLLQHDGDRDGLVEAEGAVLAGQRRL